MTKNPTSLTTLQISAGVAALAAVAQTLLGFLIALGNFSLLGVHSTMAMIALLASVVAAVASVLWLRSSGNRGLMMHAVGMGVVALVQFGLGEMGGGLATVHIILGVVFLVGAVGLATLAVRKPGAVTA